MVDLVDKTGQRFRAATRAEWIDHWDSVHHIYATKHFGSIPHQLGFCVMVDDQGLFYVICDEAGLEQLKEAGVCPIAQ